MSEGLENLHQMTKETSFELHVDMEDFEGNRAFSHYSSFQIGSEDGGYILTVSSFKNGSAGELQYPAVHVCPVRNHMRSSMGFGCLPSTASKQEMQHVNMMDLFHYRRLHAHTQWPKIQHF